MGEIHLHEFKVIEASVQKESPWLDAATDKTEPLVKRAGRLVGCGHLQHGKANSRQATGKGDEVLHELTPDGTPTKLRRDIQAPKEYLVTILWVELAAKRGHTNALLVREAAKKEYALRLVSVHAGLKFGKITKRLLFGQWTNKLRHIAHGMTAYLLVNCRIGRL